MPDPVSPDASRPIDPVLVEFASGLAHDLSNAFNAVGLHADMAKLLLERGETAQALRMIDGVQVEFRRTVHLMNALRRFATAPNNLALEPIAAAALLGEARESAALLLDADPASIVFTGAADVGEVVVDREAMVYVLVQLVRNALEAGATRIGIEARRSDGHWHLHVEDDGHGMDDEVRAQLFRMFSSSRRKDGHLGLGLWVVDRLCTAHGGRIRARAANGAGAAFDLDFPA